MIEPRNAYRRGDRRMKRMREGGREGEGKEEAGVREGGVTSL